MASHPICCQSAWLSQALPFPRNCSPSGSQQRLSSLGYKDTDVSVTRVAGAIPLPSGSLGEQEVREDMRACGAYSWVLPSPPPAGIAPIVTIFLDPLHPSSPRSDGAASCCCSPDAASCWALGFPFSWKRPVCNEHRHGISPHWILKWTHL